LEVPIRKPSTCFTATKVRVSPTPSEKAGQDVRPPAPHPIGFGVLLQLAPGVLGTRLLRASLTIRSDKTMFATAALPRLEILSSKPTTPAPLFRAELETGSLPTETVSRSGTAVLTSVVAWARTRLVVPSVIWALARRTVPPGRVSPTVTV